MAATTFDQPEKKMTETQLLEYLLQHHRDEMRRRLNENMAALMEQLDSSIAMLEKQLEDNTVFFQAKLKILEKGINRLKKNVEELHQQEQVPTQEIMIKERDASKRFPWTIVGFVSYLFRLK